jgi:formylglycine-generating enzyme required for sulfatase activity
MKRLALLVGISEYPEFKDLKPLHGSLLDVDAMRRVLVTNGEFAEEDVVILKNALRQEIEESIHNLFNARERQKDDLVLFYFSGHGIVDEGNKLFLGTPSTRKEGHKIVKPTTVAATYLQEAMSESKSQHQVLIFNCCFSGAFAQGMTVMDDGSVNLKNQLGGKGRAILTSSSMVQPSFQPDGEMSIYTRYLVEGIETGAADQDGDSKISIDELHEYAALKVSQESPNMTPAFYPVEQGGKIYIAKVVQAKDDPQLVYRRELESRMIDGNWSIPAKRLLKDLQINLGLSSEEEAQIRENVLKPILEKARKLLEYEELLKEILPPSTQELKDLRDYQKDYLGLRDDDVTDIEFKYGVNIVIPPKVISHIASNPTLLNQEVKQNNIPASNQLFLKLPNDVNIELVVIPAGSFMMGSDNYDTENPIHEVNMSSFKMSKYPITLQQYKSVMGADVPLHFYFLLPSGKNLPVNSVSWHNAVVFCKRLSDIIGQTVRLPSESQWEYACRAGSSSKYCFGEDIRQLWNYAWYDKNTKSTCPIGLKLPNTFGLHDMHGNVWEWCEDIWHDSYDDAPTDGSAWISSGDENKAVIRGGSYCEDENNCHSATRFGQLVDKTDATIGFRIVI